jgi:hypothetical protein
VVPEESYSVEWVVSDWDWENHIDRKEGCASYESVFHNIISAPNSCWSVTENNRRYCSSMSVSSGYVASATTIQGERLAHSYSATLSEPFIQAKMLNIAVNVSGPTEFVTGSIWAGTIRVQAIFDTYSCDSTMPVKLHINSRQSCEP